MSADGFQPRHKDDFDNVYDLDDPRPYFRGLAPTDYRMPDVVAAALGLLAERMERRKGNGDRLRVLDFACGYGTVGALARHDVSARDLYDHFDRNPWSEGERIANWDADREALAGRRRPAGGRLELGGIDIARTALEYAQHLGFVDRWFHENLAEHPPSETLADFIATTDLVFEAGAVGYVLHRVAENLLGALPRPHQPWLLLSPRPDIDWTRLREVLARFDYVMESCFDTPVRYRRPLTPDEESEVRELGVRFGVPEDRIFVDGYIAVDLTLARPREQAEDPPIERLFEEPTGIAR